MTEVAESTPAVADLLARARVYVEGSQAKQTLEADAADWKHFTTWCDEHKRRALPAAPEMMALRADAKRHHLLPPTLWRGNGAEGKAPLVACLEQDVPRPITILSMVEHPSARVVLLPGPAGTPLR